MAIFHPELQNLAKENTESLAEFDYFTILKANGAKQAFTSPQDHRMTFDSGAVTLSYLLPLKAPLSTKTLSLEIYDPSFFISFSLSESADAIELTGASKGCAMSVSRPKSPNPTRNKACQNLFIGPFPQSRMSACNLPTKLLSHVRKR